MEDKTKQKIEEMIKNHRVFLFMKGEPNAPACTFSSVATAILNNLHADYGSCDVLENPEIRGAIKEYSDWPTIPQLYIEGKFIGGSDIMQELFKNGELQGMLKS